MKQPCEYNTHKVLPTIRNGLTKLLTEAGMNQVEISEILGISQAAVSHYASNKRGDESLLEIYPEIDKSIRELGEEITNGLSPKERQVRICSICKDFHGRLMKDSFKGI